MAAAPIATWLTAAVVSLGGQLIALDALPTLREVALRILPPALALALASVRLSLGTGLRIAGFAAAGAGLMIAAHVGYRHAFGINDIAAFEAHVMAQRTVWQMLLAGAAVAAWFARSRIAATVIGAVSLAHFAWFTLLVQNPLRMAQDVGFWLLPAYLTAGAMAVAAAYAWTQLKRSRDIALMILTSLFGFSALRQVAHGSLLLDGSLGAGEDIARSVLAIVLAIAFLWVGIVRASRDWRVIATIGCRCNSVRTPCTR